MELVFRKRAQIFVAELAHEDPAKYQYPDLNQITIFADYRIP